MHHNGPCYQLRDARLSPTPCTRAARNVVGWSGTGGAAAGRTPGRRVDRLGLITPTEAAVKRQRVEAAAAAAGRSIDPEHFGVNLTYSRGPLPAATLEQLRRRRPDLNLTDFIPQSRTALHERVDEWLCRWVLEVPPAASRTSHGLDSRVGDPGGGHPGTPDMTIPLLTVLRLSDTCGGHVHEKRTADARLSLTGWTANTGRRCVRRLRRAQGPTRPGMVPGPLRAGALLC